VSAAQAAVVAVICLFAAVGVWRVMIKQELTWMEFATLMVAICVYPVHMARIAFRRKKDTP
jgi:hypothetical protein